MKMKKSKGVPEDGETRDYQGWQGGGPPHHDGTGNQKHKILDMPLFEGSTPDGWILTRGISSSTSCRGRQIEAMVMSLKGDALLMFQYRQRPISRQEDMKGLVLSPGSLHKQWLANQSWIITGNLQRCQLPWKGCHKRSPKETSSKVCIMTSRLT